MRAETEGASGKRSAEENREGKGSVEPEQRAGGNEGRSDGRNEGREPEETRGNRERAGRVEATVRRKLEAGKGRNRDQVAKS